MWRTPNEGLPLSGRRHRRDGEPGTGGNDGMGLTSARFCMDGRSRPRTACSAWPPHPARHDCLKSWLLVPRRKAGLLVDTMGRSR